MREQLNNNPLAQLGIVAVLLLAAGFFLMSTMGGGGEEAEETPVGAVSTTVTGVPPEGAIEAPVEGAVAPVTGGAVVPPPDVAPPRPVLDAWKSGATVAILFTRDGGIDDHLVQQTASSLSGFPGVESFIVPARQIARYASLTGGVGVERVPALMVISPRAVSGGVPKASVSYGFRSPESIRQAVVDAGYKGPTLPYHP